MGLKKYTKEELFEALFDNLLCYRCDMGTWLTEGKANIDLPCMLLGLKETGKIHR